MRWGRTTWLIARAVGDGQPKYLGLPIAKWPYTSTIRLQRTDIVIVEGVLDAIVLWQWGYSVVALLGTAAKDEWLPPIARLETPYISLGGVTLAGRVPLHWRAGWG